MGELRECPECESRVVLENSGGVHRAIICNDCNVEMNYVGRVVTEYDVESSSYRIDN